MFSNDLKLCGISTGPHKEQKTCIQLIYVDKLLEEGEMMTLNINGKEMTPEMMQQLKEKGLDKNINVIGDKQGFKAIHKHDHKLALQK